MNKPRFLVVVPSIRQKRPGFGTVMGALRASLTVPTDLQILDGILGKAQTLNAAQADLLAQSDADYYVTLDDDLLMKPGWQDLLIAGFAANSAWGALGIYVGDQHREYMGIPVDAEPLSQASVNYFRASAGHVVGCLVACRRGVAMGIGPIPNTREKYQFWEDGWRGGRVREMGLESAYMYDPRLTPTIFFYEEDPAYVAMKAADIASAQARLRGTRLRRLAGRFRQAVRPGIHVGAAE